MKINKLILLSLVSVVFASCSLQKPPTRAEAFEHFYNERPASIVVLPPVNKTANVEAKEFFATTMHRPLANYGYYIVPPLLMTEVLQNEGAYDTEMFLDQSLASFGEVFQANLALFPIIHKWKKIGLLGTIHIDIEFIFKDIETNEVVFTRFGEFVYNANNNSGGNILVSLLANVIATKFTDYVPVARQCVEMLIIDLPFGKYHEEYITDGKYRVRHGNQIRVTF
jgi:hypothetical protein